MVVGQCADAGEARLRVVASRDIWEVTAQAKVVCSDCLPVRLGNASSDAILEFTVPTRGSVDLALLSTYGSPPLKFSRTYGEQSGYELLVPSLELREICTPVSAYTPLWISFALMAALWGVALYCAKLLKSWREKSAAEGGSDNTALLLPHGRAVAAPVAQSPQMPRRRVESLDVFRGLALTIMIFVNYGGGGYWFFAHSEWDGLTVADLVFPWFVFMSGVSLPLSLSSQLRRGATRRAVLTKAAKRAAKLFLLGMLLNSGGGVVLKEWRVPGVLQYFAFSGFVATMITVVIPELRCGRDGVFRDMAPFALRHLCTLGILALYVALQQGVRLDGCPRGYTGAGGRTEQGAHTECTGGASRAIDLWLFGEHHMYHRQDGATGAPASSATCSSRWAQNCTVYDPEGALGSLVASVVCLLGVQAGQTLLRCRAVEPRTAPPPHASRLVRWMAWGTSLCAVALALCGGVDNAGVAPINKNLWSSSFGLMLSGMGFIVLAALYAAIDGPLAARCGTWSWGGEPFAWVGKNSILIYVGHEVLESFFPFSWRWAAVGETAWGREAAGAPLPYFASHAELLASNIGGTLCWVLVAWLLWRNQVFVKV